MIDEAQSEEEDEKMSDKEYIEPEAHENMEVPEVDVKEN